MNKAIALKLSLCSFFRSVVKSPDNGFRPCEWIILKNYQKLNTSFSDKKIKNCVFA
jgi:hypothetical protein